MAAQKLVFGIITVPYGETPMEYRSDVDNEIHDGLGRVKAHLTDVNQEIGDVTFTILDEHGVSEWMAEVIEKGLVA